MFIGNVAFIGPSRASCCCYFLFPFSLASSGFLEDRLSQKGVSVKTRTHFLSNAFSSQELCPTEVCLSPPGMPAWGLGIGHHPPHPDFSTMWMAERSPEPKLSSLLPVTLVLLSFLLIISLACYLFKNRNRIHFCEGAFLYSFDYWNGVCSKSNLDQQ